MLSFVVHCLGSLSVEVKVDKFGPPGFMWEVPGSNFGGDICPKMRFLDASAKLRKAATDFVVFVHLQSQHETTRLPMYRFS